MTDLIERLRSDDNALDAVDEAAAEIEQLRARVSKIEKLQSKLESQWGDFLQSRHSGLSVLQCEINELGDIIKEVVGA